MRAKNISTSITDNDLSTNIPIIRYIVSKIVKIMFYNHADIFDRRKKREIPYRSMATRDSTKN